MEEHSLIIPEFRLLSTILSFADVKTLKSCRLVSKFWSTHAGNFLPTSSWIRLVVPKPLCVPKNNKRSKNLQLTLEGSSDPSKFFRRLQVYVDRPIGRRLNKLLESYGKFLHTFCYHVDFKYNTNTGYKIKMSDVQKVILKLLTRWCPQLQEFHLTIDSCYARRSSYNFNRTDLTYPLVHFDLNSKGPLNLRTIQLAIRCGQVDELFQNFLVKMVEGSRNLKCLRIYTGYGVENKYNNDRLYQKLAELKKITKNLGNFVWIADFRDDHPSKILPNFEFSKELRSLRLELTPINVPNFQIMMDSAGENLKILNIKDYFGKEKDFESKILKTVVQKLKNLETLNIRVWNADDFFSNPENLTDPPHTNLKRLLLPWNSSSKICKSNSLISLVKWFPNLTLLSLTIGNKIIVDDDGIKFQEAVKVLSGLKMLKNLLLRTLSPTGAEGDLRQTLKALQDIPSLQCISLVDTTTSKYLINTYTFEDLKPFLVGTRNLNLIRLIGFKLDGQKSMVEFAKGTGISLDLFRGCNRQFDDTTQEFNSWNTRLDRQNVEDLALFDPKEYLN